MRARLIVVVLAAWCARAGGEESAREATSQARFDAATQLEAHGQFRAAADALEQLGHERSADSFAADALYEAAVVCEERLAEPARAQRLYEEVAARYPQSRLARRARTRADFLKASLVSGEAPLAEYEAIMNSAGTLDRGASIARMEALLRAHPDFALADRALFWLGNAWVQQRDDARAMRAYTELEQRFPSSEWAQRARKSRADLLLAHAHPFAARALYDELARAADPLARAAGREGLASARTYLIRAAIAIAAAAYLLAFVLLSLYAARKTLRIPPFEAVYYIPVALLFIAAAATENRLIGWSTAAIAIGGALIVWLSAAASTARLARGEMSIAERLWRAAAVLIAVLALTYLAIVMMGLSDMVLETFRSGPERG